MMSFVVAGNVIDSIKAKGLTIGVDNNYYLIKALELIRDNPESLPKNNKQFTEQDYQRIRKDPEFRDKNPGLYGYAGITFSFGGKWFGGWSRDGFDRDYVRQAFDNAQKQSKNLKGKIFVYSEYDHIDILPNSLVYCDPPYQGTTKYKTTFDHEKFWNWVRTESEKNIVLVSEYQAPEDFVPIWKGQLLATTGKNKEDYKKATEKLFIHKGKLDEL